MSLTRITNSLTTHPKNRHVGATLVAARFGYFLGRTQGSPLQNLFHEHHNVALNKIEKTFINLSPKYRHWRKNQLKL